MKRSVPHIVEYKHSETSGWCIDARIGGKRKRLFFTTKTAAKKELARIKIKQRQEGMDALSLSDDLRIAALTIQKELAPFGKTLRDAGAHYLKFLKDGHRSITVSALADEYLALKQRLGLSPLHLKDLRNRYKIFCSGFGQTLIRTIEAEQVESWLHGLSLSAQSINNYKGRLSALFRYAVKKKYLDHNLIADIETIRSAGEPPEIFKVDELRKLLECAPAELLPAFALGAFAGIRSAELLRLDWSDIDLRRGFINVPASKAKSARRRLITMAPNLREWLAPYASHTGPIWAECTSAYHRASADARKTAGLTSWPNNGLRHSFASHHIAKHQDAAKLALDLGHTNSKLIFSNYREIVTPEEGERYFAITPLAPAENIVSMAAGS
jgi:integrase